MRDFLMNIIEMLESAPLFVRVALLGALPAFLTFVGTFPVMYRKSLDKKFIDVGMGFSAGIMLVASFTSLLIPATELGGMLIVILGFIFGVILIFFIDKLVPHEHLIKGYEGLKKFGKIHRKTLLIALAMIVHNIPEGMAVGIAAIHDISGGLILAVAIGLQDIPEGLAVAIPVYASIGKKGYAMFVGGLSGLFELFAAFIPFVFVMAYHNAIGSMMSFLMALAAGAMVYVVIHEIIPEIYGHGYDDQSTLGFFIGFILMLLLDSLL